MPHRAKIFRGTDALDLLQGDAPLTAAIQAMNGALLDGRSIAVREAVERQPGGGSRDGGGFRPRGPRSPYGGGGGGRGYGSGGGYRGGRDGGGGGYRGGGRG